MRIATASAASHIWEFWRHARATGDGGAVVAEGEGEGLTGVSRNWMASLRTWSIRRWFKRTKVHMISFTASTVASRAVNPESADMTTIHQQFFKQTLGIEY